MKYLLFAESTKTVYSIAEIVRGLVPCVLEYLPIVINLTPAE